MRELTTAELCKSDGKKSLLTLKSGKKLEVSLVEGSFRRITGMWEQMDDSGSALLRRVEIRREPGRSLGFYVQQGDGWLRRNGIFVSRVNLGSPVQTSGLLSVGDEIVLVNSVDVRGMRLDDAVLVMQFSKRLLLTVRILLQFGFTDHFSLARSLSRRLPNMPTSPSSCEGTPSEGSDARHGSEDTPPEDSDTRRGSKDAPPEGSDVGRGPERAAGSRKSTERKKFSWTTKRALFKSRRKDDTLTDSMLKSTAFGESFIRNLEATVEDSHRRKYEVTAAQPSYDRLSLSSEEEKANGLEDTPLPPSSSLPPPSSTEEEVSPYARVSIRVDEGSLERTLVVHTEPASAPSPPYEEVTIHTSTPVKAKKPTNIEPYEEVRFSDGGRRVESGDPTSPYAQTSNMKLDGLLEMLRSKPVLSPSPIVKRKSDVLDEESTLYPDHIYAQVDRTQKTNATPPPPPTSPLPHDESIDVIANVMSEPLVIPADPETPYREGGTAGVEKEVGLASSLEHQVMSSDTEPLDPDTGDTTETDQEKTPTKRVIATDKAIEQLLGPEGPAPPLPPPYVPDEGPPEWSDEEQQEEEEVEEEVLAESASSSRERQEDITAIKTDLPVIITPVEEDTPPVPELTDAIQAEIEAMTDYRVISEASSLTDVTPPASPDAEKDSSGVGAEVWREEDSSCAPGVVVDVTEEGKVDVEEEGEKELTGRAEGMEEGREGEGEREVREEHEDKGLQGEEEEEEEDSKTDIPTLDRFDPEMSELDETYPPPLRSLADMNISRDSYSDLPPPPPPPGEPPLDDEEEEDQKEEDLLEEEIKDFVLFPTMKRDDHDQHSQESSPLSGALWLTIHGLDTSSTESESFWSSHDVQKVVFLTTVDSRVKINASIPLMRGEISAEDTSDDEEDRYQLLLLKCQELSFTLNPLCLPALSRVAQLHDALSETKRRVYVDFEHYGRLKLTLEHRPLSSMVLRMEAEGYSKPSFSELVSLNPRHSGCPLILEQCIEVIEQYGLKSPHLYQRCTPTSHKNRALTACVTGDWQGQGGVKRQLNKCSVHAYTALVVEFFCQLPEPFFTNDISSSLTQSASAVNTRDGDGMGVDLSVIQSFLQCLPEDVITTLNLLLRHFRRVLRHGSKNGLTEESLCGLFGPLLLIPSLSPDLNTSTTALQYAEEFESQARVMELLLGLSKKKSAKQTEATA